MVEYDLKVKGTVSEEAWDRVVQAARNHRRTWEIIAQMREYSWSWHGREVFPIFYLRRILYNPKPYKRLGMTWSGFRHVEHLPQSISALVSLISAKVRR